VAEAGVRGVAGLASRRRPGHRHAAGSGAVRRVPSVASAWRFAALIAEVAATPRRLRSRGRMPWCARPWRTSHRLPRLAAISSSLPRPSGASLWRWAVTSGFGDSGGLAPLSWCHDFVVSRDYDRHL